MTILVSCGKGRKQRLVPLSPKLLTELRLFWQTHRHPIWLFPGETPQLHLPRRSKSAKSSGDTATSSSKPAGRA